MARQKTPPAAEHHVPRLYLATPPVDDPAALLAALPQVLASADIAAVLLRCPVANERTLTNHAKALAPVIQSAGAALLLDGHASLVGRSGADGAHLSGLAAMEADLANLQPDRIAGVGALLTKHDAMVAGEAGADYLLFGEPDAKGQRPSSEDIAERLQWWAELFQPPCVGYAATLDEVTAFTQANADFIFVEDLVWADPRGPVAALQDIVAAINAAIATPAAD